MKYLLDTHVFLWATGESHRLSSKLTDVLSAPDNDVFVSAISFWEIAIKVRAGKLDISGRKPGELPGRAEQMGFIPIELTSQEAATMAGLAEDTHFDPFDRILIWQAITRKLTLVSGDKEFKRFEKDGLKLFWQ